MTDIDTEAAREALTEIAESTASDIRGDFPGLETAYDLYIEFLLVGTDRWPYTRRVLVGVIDMGDVYGQVFEYHEGEEEPWEPVTADHGEVVDRILAERAL